MRHRAVRQCAGLSGHTPEGLTVPSDIECRLPSPRAQTFHLENSWRNVILKNRTSVSAVTSIESAAGSGRKMTLRGFFGRNGLLARSHPSYEYRPGQLQMAEAVQAALADKKHLVVEAGTGTGKTLAYLVPCLLSGKRIVISTGTKNLQEQLFFKDLPFLQQLFETPLSVCYMKGRANYLCRQKLYDAEREPVLHGVGEAREFVAIRDWELGDETGWRSELRLLPENSSAWWKMDARSDLCAGQKCKQFDRCFITAMHRR